MLLFSGFINRMNVQCTHYILVMSARILIYKNIIFISGRLQRTTHEVVAAKGKLALLTMNMFITVSNQFV